MPKARATKPVHFWDGFIEVNLPAGETVEGDLAVKVLADDSLPFEEVPEEKPAAAPKQKTEAKPEPKPDAAPADKPEAKKAPAKKAPAKKAAAS